MADESHSITALEESMRSLGFLTDRSRYALLLQCVRARMDEKREKSGTPLYIQCDDKSENADLQFQRPLRCVLEGLPYRMREDLRVSSRIDLDDASQDLIFTTQDVKSLLSGNGGAYLILRTGETNLEKRRLNKVERNYPYLRDAANLAPERIPEFFKGLDDCAKVLGDADASNDRIRKVAWELYWDGEKFLDKPNLGKFAGDERRLKFLMYDVVKSGAYSLALKGLLEEIGKRVPDENLTESLRNAVRDWLEECDRRFPPDAPPSVQSAQADTPRMAEAPPQAAPDTPRMTKAPPQAAPDTPQIIGTPPQAAPDDGQTEFEKSLTALPDLWPPKDGWEFLVQLCRCFNVIDRRTGKPVAQDRENALVAELIRRLGKRGVLLSPEERDMLRMAAHVHDLKIFRTLHGFFRALEARSILDLLRISPNLFAACAKADAWRVAAYAERLLENVCTQFDPPWNPIPLDLWLYAGGVLRGPEIDCFRTFELHPDAAILSDKPELVVTESALLKRTEVRKRGASYVRTHKNGVIASRVSAWLTLAENAKSGGI